MTQRSRIGWMVVLLSTLMIPIRTEASFTYTASNTFTPQSPPPGANQGIDGYNVDITAGGIYTPTSGTTNTYLPLGTIAGSTSNGSIVNYADGAAYNSGGNMMAGPIMTKIAVTITVAGTGSGTITIGGGLTGTADYSSDARDMNVSLTFDNPTQQKGSVQIGDTIYTLTIGGMYPGSNGSVFDQFPDSNQFHVVGNNYDVSYSTLYGSITTTTAVPEPGSLAMTFIGSTLLIGYARSKSRLARSLRKAV